MANTTTKTIYSISLVTLISISLFFTIHHHHHHHSKFFYSNFSASFPVSWYAGGYTFALTLGTPSQEVSLTIDTGSSLVWVPCSFPLTNYTCFHCDSSNLSFKPNISSSYSFVGCTSPQCKLASRYTCYSTYYYCQYEQHYGIGDTTGLLSTETLRLGTHNVPQFMVSCSTSSSQLTTGLVGFNNHPASLPKQLGLRKFAYCFSSSSCGTLILGSSNPEVKSLSYTPFLTSSDPKLQQFYYVLLRSITVGDTRINIPSSYMLPNNGATKGQGMLVDSSTTYMITARNVQLALSSFVSFLGREEGMYSLLSSSSSPSLTPSSITTAIQSSPRHSPPLPPLLVATTLGTSAPASFLAPCCSLLSLYLCSSYPPYSFQVVLGAISTV